MTPESLVEKLEELGLIDAKILKKLRKQTDNPEKRVSARKILSFLVKKDFLTRDQAVQLKRELEQGAAEELNQVEEEVEELGLAEDVAEELGLAEDVEEELGLAEDVEEEEVDFAEDFEPDEHGLGTDVRETLEEPPDDDDLPAPAGIEKTDDLVAGVISSSAVVSAEESAEAELDDPAEPEGDEAPTVMGHRFQRDEFMEEKTVVIDPEYADPIGNVEALGDPVASTWEETMVAPATAGHRLGFEGKIDSSDQWATKWVYIGFATLGMLLVAGTLLYFVLAFISAEDRFEAANQSFQDGTYGDAIKKFNEFLDKHPSHEKAPVAKVSLVEAMLLESYRQKNWDETIVRAERQLPPLVEDDSINWDGIRQNLAVWLPNSTLEIAKRATKQASRSGLVEHLAKARNAKNLVDNPIYIPNSYRKKELTAKTLLQIDEEIAKGEVLIDKQDQFDATLGKIAAFREQGQTDQAFDAYNKLIRSYGDLRADERLQQEMRQVSQQEAQQVKPVDSAIESRAGWRSSPIESTTVLASKTGEPIQSLSGEVVPVLADASVYGIDIGDGSVRWRRFVGYQTRIQPIPVGATNILLSDQLNHDLILVSAKDGQVVWRNEVGEPFLAPQVDEDMILLTAESGNLFRLDLASGAVQASAKIPQTANVPMTRSPRTGLIYQPGFYSNIYVLSEDDLSCKDVFYLGHYRGSISVPVVVWNSFVVVAVNDSGICDLSVLRPNNDTGDLELVQNVIRITRGIVTNPLVKFGRFMLINSETGDLKILEMNTAEASNPIRTLAEEKFENRDSAKTYLATSGSDLWVGARGLIRYKVSRSQGTFKRQQIANANDFFVGPIRKFGDSIVHVRKRTGSAHTSVSAVDGETLKQTWRTDVGGPVAGPPVVAGEKVLAISSQGDLFLIAFGSTGDQVATDTAKSSNIVEDLLFQDGIQLSETTWAYHGVPGASELLYLDVAADRSKLVRLPAPADAAVSPPIRVGKDLVFATRPGQVVRVDPANGSIVGTPFLPPVSPGVEQQWKKPAVVNDSQFVVANETMFFLVDASSDTLLKKIAELKLPEQKLVSDLATDGSQIFVAVEKDGLQKLIAIQVGTDNLAAGASVDLPNRLLDGPWVVGEYVALRLDDGKLACFDQQLVSHWATEVDSGTLASAPIIDGNSIRMYFSNGKSIAIGLGTGQVESEFELGQPIIHHPVFVSGKAIVAGLDGTIHTISTSAQ